ncbi:MAG: competence protein [Bacilli bacterium]|jgi:competence protein ComK|nr:competence protein [Bacilli bacterium]
MENYEINSKTLALIALKNKTEIFEEESHFIVDKSANEIMEESCAYFGSSLKGRQKGTEFLIGVSYKAPVIVEESKEMIFFPTSSPRKENCSWISLQKINKYFRAGEKMVIEFKNGSRVVLDLSFGILDNQVLRATRLESVLRGRKK